MTENGGQSEKGLMVTLECKMWVPVRTHLEFPEYAALNMQLMERIHFVLVDC